MFAARNLFLTALSLPVVYDATGAGITGTGTAKTVTETHVLGASAQGIVVGAHVGSTTSSPTVTALVGSTSLTQLGSFLYLSGTDIWHLILFGLIGPPTGSQTISVSVSSGTDFVAMNSVSYDDVASFGTVATTSGTGTSPSHTVTTGAPNERIFQMFGNAGNTAAFGDFSAYNQTSRWNANSSTSNGATLIGDAAGASSVVFSATLTGTVVGWGSIAVPVIP